MSNVIAAFSIDHVKQLTELSVNQLRDWDNDGFFAPSLAYSQRRSPYSRVYSFDDVVGLRALSILRSKYGVSRQHLRRAAERLKAYSGRPWSELTLYVLNREVHFKNPSTGEVEGAVSGQLAAPIPLGTIADDVRARAEGLRQRDRGAVGHIERNRYTVYGEAVIKGTRIPVATVVRFSEAGYSPEAIVEQYPDLTLEDVSAAIDYNRGLTRAA